MHGLRRRLSEPRMAGHRPADRSANQRVTSAGDSFLCIRTCGINHTYIQSKKQGENRSCGKLEKCRIYWAILGFATETSLRRAVRGFAHPPSVNCGTAERKSRGRWAIR